VTICPCCGSKKTGDWSDGCACGARRVGEPLPRPEHELPSYARALMLTATGALLVLVLVAQTVGAFAEMIPTSKTYAEAFAQVSAVIFEGSMWQAAAQIAAWQLKWVAIPVALLVMFGSRKLYRSVQESPDRFCGLSYARRGYIASAAVPLMVLILIGATVPDRLQQRNDRIEAGNKAIGYEFDRVSFQYKQEFGTYPANTDDLKRLKDPDGSIAALLKEIDGAEYKASAEVAAVPTKKPQRLRGTVIRNASLDTEEPINEGLSFTDYELRLPGYDKQLFTDDDVIVRDGIVDKATKTPRRVGATTAETQVVKP
jgi:hypothetical protein